MSLQVQDGRLHLYTEQGELHLEPIGVDKEEIILSSFKAIHHKGLNR